MILLENSSIVRSLEVLWLQFGSLSSGLLWQFWVFCRFIEISVLLAIVLWKMSEVIFRDHIKLCIALYSMDIFREGNGNPLKCSCLENLRDSRAWWAACRLWGCTESDTTEATWQQQQQYGYFSSIITYNPSTWNIFPFLWIIFNQK